MRTTTSGNPMAILHQKMKRLKPVLRKFNQDEYDNISGRVQGKRKELAETQVFILNCQGDTEMIENEKKLALELSELLQAEESFYKQKARVSWLREGDQNTRFFHKMVAAKRRNSLITSLIDTGGNKLTRFDQISSEAVMFFENLLGTVDLNESGCSKEVLGELLTTKLSREAALDMSRPVCSEEIKLTMFGINREKALEPDGYFAKFFKEAWSVVGADVVME